MSSDSTVRLTGRVKWFNNKTGYGFITVTDGSSAGTDVFVHHSAIGVSSEQYKYLVQGEYVEFSMVSVPNSSHTHQADSVTGIKGGKLMCETRHDTRVMRTNFRTSGDATAEQRKQSPVRVSRPGSGRGDTSGRGAGRGAGRGSGRGSGRGAPRQNKP